MIPFRFDKQGDCDDPLLVKWLICFTYRNKHTNTVLLKQCNSIMPIALVIKQSFEGHFKRIGT